MKQFQVNIPFEKMIEFLSIPRDLEELHITRDIRILLGATDHRRGWTIMVGTRKEFDELNRKVIEFGDAMKKRNDVEDETNTEEK